MSEQSLIDYIVSLPPEHQAVQEYCDLKRKEDTLKAKIERLNARSLDQSGEAHEYRMDIERLNQVVDAKDKNISDLYAVINMLSDIIAATGCTITLTTTPTVNQGTNHEGIPSASS
jgi:hypothetical protein